MNPIGLSPYLSAASIMKMDSHFPEIPGHYLPLWGKHIADEKTPENWFSQKIMFTHNYVAEQWKQHSPFPLDKVTNQNCHSLTGSFLLCSLKTSFRLVICFIGCWNMMVTIEMKWLFKGLYWIPGCVSKKKERKKQMEFEHKEKRPSLRNYLLKW